MAVATDHRRPPDPHPGHHPLDDLGLIAIVLGGAASVWDDLAAAERLVSRPYIIAANLAGIHYTGHLHGWATLHTEHADAWASQRAGNKDFTRFAPDTLPERWPGSSGLYAAQAALFEANATGAILCGVPMDRAGGHFDRAGPWESVTSYRRAFELALPVIGARVRSMGGWTADLFGKPTPEWVKAIDTAKPIQSPTRSQPMFNVTNTTKETKRFWNREKTAMVSVEPGATVRADIDPKQPRFQTGELKVKPVTTEPTAKPEKA